MSREKTQLPTAVVSPLAGELAALRGRVRVEDRRAVAGRRVVAGRLAGRPVVLAATGDGERWAAAGLAALLENFEVGRVLALGVAGGLSPGLEPGALIVAARVRRQGGESPPPDAGWLARALAADGAAAGTVVSATTIVGDPAAKAALWRSLPAAGGPAAVDLESAAYAEAAAAHGLPYLVVRAVLDPAEEELPLDFEACRDADGRVRAARVLLRALARPAALPALARLRSRLAWCAARLAAVAERVVAA